MVLPKSLYQLRRNTILKKAVRLPFPSKQHPRGNEHIGNSAQISEEYTRVEHQ